MRMQFPKFKTRGWLGIALVLAAIGLARGAGAAEPAGGGVSSGGSNGGANAGTSGSSSAAIGRASELIKNRQYNDAIKVLDQDIKGKADEALVRQHFMLGECHYQLKQYELARPLFAKAARAAAEEADKTVAEYRLACVAFRLKEPGSAAERIDAFVSAHPADQRVGVLLTFKMQLLAAKGKPAETELVGLHNRIVADARRFGAATVMESDEILCDYYRGSGQDDKALGMYTRILANYRSMIAELEREKQPIPPAYEKTHDNAALQLGAIALEKKQYNEATKWLENVRYDPDMKVRARLLLAKMAYEKGDYAAVVSYLMDKNFLGSLQDGPSKSDVYLMLGLAEKARPDGKAARIEEWLKGVAETSRGYPQAQGALGDVYREKGLGEQALRCYAAAMASADHAPSAMYWTGAIILDRAEKEPDRVKAAGMNMKAAELLGQLLQKYPMSAQARPARERIAELAKKGVPVGAAAGADEMLKGWERVAKEKPGSAEAAQALGQIIRVQSRTSYDEKTRKPVKGPNYGAAASAADRLLDEKVYRGAGMAEGAWKAIRCEALYQRALAELASLNPAKELEAVGAVYLKGAGADRAVEWLNQAKQIVDARQLELVKGIELSLLEAMFKSDKKESREQAEKRFGELEADYGNDPRFARLSLELANFYQSKGQFVEAADQYSGSARRGRDMSPDDAVKLWYTAGTLYSRAAYETQQKGALRDYGVYIYPKEMMALGLDDAIRADGRFMREVVIRWPKENMTAKEALLTLSKATGIPFVWPTAKGRETIGAYLDEKRVTLKDGKFTAESALGLILDAKQHRIAPDIGLADGTPTIAPAKAGAEAQADPAANQAIEIYDIRQEAGRLKSLGRNYGVWRTIHAAGAKSRDAGVLLYDVLQRIETLAGVHIAWADTLDRQSKLGVELRERDLVGISPGGDATCEKILAAALDKADLRFRIVARELAGRYYEQANKSFNEARKIDPTGKYAEKSLFAVAVNYYNLRDYPRMKQVLKTYLKLFDNPENETYQQACFWTGYALESEKKYREAVNYYARAAEERLVIIKADAAAAGSAGTPGAGSNRVGSNPGGSNLAGPISAAALKPMLSYDSQFALSEPLSGAFAGVGLAQVADFIQVNTHVSIRIDSGVSTEAIKIDRPAFKGVSGLDLLADILKPLGLTCRVENVNPDYAEKAYFRLAAAYRRDNLLEQALENCGLLLARYPRTEKRRDASRLMLDIHRGMGDFAKAIATLEELRKTATDSEEKRRLDAEMAGLLFEMADYEKAAAGFSLALAAAKDPGERVAAREGYARSLARLGKKEQALAEYEALLKEESTPLAAFVDSMMAFQLKYALGKALEREFPEEALKYVMEYGKLSDNQRQRLSAEQGAKAMSIYYVLGLIDLDKNRIAEGVEKLEAARNSPDDLLGGEAGMQVGMIHMARSDWAAAKAAFQDLLLQTRSNEARVRGTYELGVCHEKLGETAEAGKRFAEVIARFPASPLARAAGEHEAYKARRTTMPVGTEKGRVK